MLKFAETLDADGLAFQPEALNLGTKAVDAYVCKGTAGETWEPRCTYHSFRYVQMEGFPSEPTLDMLEGRFVTSQMEPAMRFECSDDLFNRLHTAFVRTGMENTQHKITDCPSREKTGWLPYPTFLIMMHNFEAQPLLTKLLGDAETKTVSFRVGKQTYTNVCRTILLGRRSSWYPEGAVGTILLPWEIYLHYGDRRLLERHFPFMQDTLRYLAALAPTGVLDSWLGDWHDALPNLDRPSATDSTNKPGAATLGATWALPLRVAAAQRAGKTQSGGFPIHTHPAIVATALLHDAAKTMTAAAKLLNKPQEAEEYEQLAQRIKNGFIAAFYKPDEASFGSQTANALALWQGLLPSNREQRVLQSLARDIRDKHRGHFSTGIFGTDRLLEVLADHGQGDVAYTLMTQKEFPSLALMLANGSTTTWETWGEAILSRTPPDHTTPLAAVRPLSHTQFVNVDTWLLQHVAGIRRDDSQPGFKAAIIWPQLTKQIDWARASYHTVHGWIENQYTVKDGRIEMTVTIPPNTTATIYVPTTRASSVVATPLASAKQLRAEQDFTVYAVPSGRYSFVADNP